MCKYLSGSVDFPLVPLGEVLMSSVESRFMEGHVPVYPGTVLVIRSRNRTRPKQVKCTQSGSPHLPVWILEGVKMPFHTNIEAYMCDRHTVREREKGRERV